MSLKNIEVQFDAPLCRCAKGLTWAIETGNGGTCVFTCKTCKRELRVPWQTAPWSVRIVGKGQQTRPEPPVPEEPAPPPPAAKKPRQPPAHAAFDGRHRKGTFVPEVLK